MAVALFLDRFLPCQLHVPSFDDVTFSGVPDKPDKESVIYSPLVSGVIFSLLPSLPTQKDDLNKVLQSSNPALAFYDTSNQVECPGKVGSSKPVLGMFRTDDVGKGNLKDTRRCAKNGVLGEYISCMGEVYMSVDIQADAGLDFFTDPSNDGTPPDHGAPLDGNAPSDNNALSDSDVLIDVDTLLNIDPKFDNTPPSDDDALPRGRYVYTVPEDDDPPNNIGPPKDRVPSDDEDPPGNDASPGYKFTINMERKYPNDKKAKYKVSALGQSTRYAHMIQARQFRTCVYSISVAGTNARLLRWDRSGVVATESFSYKSNPEFLIDFVWRFSKASREQRGFDFSRRRRVRCGKATVSRCDNGTREGTTPWTEC